MSSDRRLTRLWYDISSEKLRTSTGMELRTELRPWITYREKVLVNLKLVTDAELSEYDLSAASTFRAAIDKDLGNPILMCETLSTGINQTGEWFEGSSSVLWRDADLSKGELAIRLNADTRSFLAKIQGKGELRTSEFEVKAYNSAEDLIFTCRFKFRTKSLIDIDGQAVEDAEQTQNFEWFTHDGAQCLRIVNDQGEVLDVLCPPGITYP